MDMGVFPAALGGTVLAAVNIWIESCSLHSHRVSVSRTQHDICGHVLCSMLSAIILLSYWRRRFAT